MESFLTTDFGELSNDTKFIATINKFQQNLYTIDQFVNTTVEFKDIEKISKQERVKIDNYVAYSINSLYWMLLKLRGNDPNEHDIKNELSRVRETILREKQIHERNTIRPVLDKGAAGRFIKHGLHIRFDKDEETTQD